MFFLVLEKESYYGHSYLFPDAFCWRCVFQHNTWLLASGGRDPYVDPALNQPQIHVSCLLGTFTVYFTYLQHQ